MGKGGKVNCRINVKRSVRDRDIGSDDSDEDYVVEFEENGSADDSEDLGNSVDEYASEESFRSFIEEDEEEEGCRKVLRSKNRKGSRANRKIRGKISRKRKRVSYEEEEEVEEEEEEQEEQEEEDEDFVNDDEDDEEFSPDDDGDFVDEEDEELTVRKRSNDVKVAKKTTKKRGRRGRQTKTAKKARVSKKPLEKRTRNKRRLKKKVRLERDDDDDDDEYEGDFIDDTVDSREKSRKNLRRRNYAVSSGSEFVLSGASDCDYTISEEEREQVREASKLFGEVKPNLRNSSSVKKLQEDVDVCQQRKSPVRKGKEKLKEVKSEMGKQVCGICLSEEDKRRFRGTLDCCSHYFCFTCIMEWSKVESRCPLCKQRFKSITKSGRAAAAVGVDMRNAVIEVPKRDQVYQPSEEEIRSFIDPYENVICTECHEGGEDGLMLLCDLCDSPAHTFCVGLGRQVPEGNWYCDGCRPVALGSSSSQPQDPLPDQRTTSNTFNRPSPVRNSGEGFGFDPVVESSPRLAFLQGFGNLPSPRFPTGNNIQVSGTGAPTVSLRRQIHRRIHNLLSISRIHNMTSRIDSIPPSNLHGDLLNPQIDRCRETETIAQNSTMPERPSRNIFLDERLQTNDHPSSSLQNDDPFSLRTGQSRVQGVHDRASTATERSVNLTLWPELSGMNSISSHQQFHQYSRPDRPDIASEVNLSPHRAGEESQFYVVKEQVQSMVKSHLKSLSQDIELGHDTFKEIARSSTHTILAACGLEHKRSEVQLVPAPSICVHGDRVIAGETSIMKGFCSSCFDCFARDVVKRIMDTRLPRWLSLGL
ncbi:uncharacterized protein [Euphorbia lathyris]|uniref:uncharacterized protein n=1 Tax=Euphorbia lathyris TaxID=212925 RepID=UPI003313A7AE